jgi:hypothetical protein
MPPLYKNAALFQWLDLSRPLSEGDIISLRKNSLKSLLIKCKIDIKCGKDSDHLYSILINKNTANQINIFSADFFDNIFTHQVFGKVILCDITKQYKDVCFDDRMISQTKKIVPTFSFKTENKKKQQPIKLCKCAKVENAAANTNFLKMIIAPLKQQ